MKEGSKFIEVNLKNVLYAPNIRRNLSSGACMDVAGFSEDNKYYFTVCRNEKLYILDVYYERDLNEIHNTQDLRTNMDMLKIHRRLGHTNVNSINQIEKKKIVKV